MGLMDRLKDYFVGDGSDSDDVSHDKEPTQLSFMCDVMGVEDFDEDSVEFMEYQKAVSSLTADASVKESVAAADKRQKAMSANREIANVEPKPVAETKSKPSAERVEAKVIGDNKPKVIPNFGPRANPKTVELLMNQGGVSYVNGIAINNGEVDLTYNQRHAPKDPYERLPNETRDEYLERLDRIRERRDEFINNMIAERDAAERATYFTYH